MRFLCIILLLQWLWCQCMIVDCVLFFPTNTAYGILGALAIPLDLPHRNVFLSYNFEANYNMPATWGIPPSFAGIEDEDVFPSVESRNLECIGNCTNVESLENLNSTITADVDDDQRYKSTINNDETKHTDEEELGRKRARRSLLSRTYFYEMLKDKFSRNGYPGEPCLLRLICETNASELGQVNGVLGSIIHVLFSPTTSWYEQLPLPFYQAEYDGQHDHCQHYETECPESILDLISQPLDEILNTIQLATE